MEVGSEKRVRGGGAGLDEPPPNNFPMSDIKPPRPAMELSPPVSALASPPEAVWESKPCQVLPVEDDAGVVLLDGFPKPILLTAGANSADEAFNPKEPSGSEAEVDFDVLEF